MFPNYTVKIAEEPEQKRRAGKSFLFDFAAGEFVMRDGKPATAEKEEALKVWIEKCLRTETGKFLIYLQDEAAYGVNVLDMVDRRFPFAFLRAEIEREITGALERNPEITSVGNFEFSRDGRTLTASFTVTSIYGEAKEGFQWQMA